MFGNLTEYYLTGNFRGTISLIVLGLVILVIGGIYEGWTKLSPIIPPRLFKVCQLCLYRGDSRRFRLAQRG
jgi:hypothetical protein